MRYKRDYSILAVNILILIGIAVLCLGWTNMVRARVIEHRIVDDIRVSFKDGFVYISVYGDTRSIEIPKP